MASRWRCGGRIWDSLWRGGVVEEECEVCICFFFLMRRRPPRSTQSRSSAASDVYKRQFPIREDGGLDPVSFVWQNDGAGPDAARQEMSHPHLSLIHISEPTRLLSISYAVFCLKKKNQQLLVSHIPPTHPPQAKHHQRPLDPQPINTTLSHRTH